MRDVFNSLSPVSPCTVNKGSVFKLFGRVISGRRLVPSISPVIVKKLCTSPLRPAMNLSSVIHVLEDGSPLHLAETWDNVGLLVEPSPPHTVHKILLTNDLTLDVCEEAISTRSDLILSYHPPIFSALKRLTQKSVKERIVVKCIENRIAVYSPHTVYDNVRDGVNQWILDAFQGFGLKDTKAIGRKFDATFPGGASHQMVLRVDPHADLLITKIEEVLNVSNEDSSSTVFVTKQKPEDGVEKLMVTLRLNECQMSNVTELLEDFPGVLESSTLTKLEKLPMPGFGAGLSASIEKEMSINTAVSCVKKHMKLSNLRLALGRGVSVDSPVSEVAVCAGSGRSVLAGCGAGLLVTGEMSHHDLLACTEHGQSVILTEHSNCERGFLAVLKERLERKFEQTDVQLSLSVKDHDPVIIL